MRSQVYVFSTTMNLLTAFGIGYHNDQDQDQDQDSYW